MTPVTFDLAAREVAFTSYVDSPGWHHGFAQGLPEIQEIDPAAVPEIPLWIGEAIHFRLRIEVRVPRAEYPLLQREAAVPYCELRRQTHRQGFVPLRGELHGLPVKVADIQGILQSPPAIHPNPHISPMQGDGRLCIIVKKPPVGK